MFAGGGGRKIPRSQQRVLLKELSQGSERQTRVMTGEPGTLVIRMRQKDIKGGGGWETVSAEEASALKQKSTKSR